MLSAQSHRQSRNYQGLSEQNQQEFTLSFSESEYDNSESFKKRFKIRSTIGNGGQAHVKEAFDMEKQEKVALKIFKKRNMNFFGLNSAYFEHSMVKELKHQNILDNKGFYEDSDYLIIVFELMSTDLRGLITEFSVPMDEAQIKEIFYQMLTSINFCHTQDIVHRDIKLENFLVDCDDTGNILVKLSDFGLACKYEQDKPPTTKCGSILSVAPEMLIKETYCHKVDIWGLGVILFELLSTDLPFYHDNET